MSRVILNKREFYYNILLFYNKLSYFLQNFKLILGYFQNGNINSIETKEESLYFYKLLKHDQERRNLEWIIFNKRQVLY